MQQSKDIKDIKYCEHDWKAKIYDKDDEYVVLSSNSDVSDMEENSFFKRRISYDKKGYYQLDFTVLQISQPHSLGSDNQYKEYKNYLSLNLTKEELENLQVSVMTNFTLTDGTNLIDAIKEKKKPMKKILLPYKEVDDRYKVTEEDITFARILIEYYQLYAEYIFNAINKVTGGKYNNHEFHSLNIVEFDYPCTLSGLIYLAQIFEQCNINFSLDADDDNCLKFIWEQPKCFTHQTDDQNNFYINSKPNIKLGELVLDIGEGFSSEDNIKAFYNHLAHSEEINNRAVYYQEHTGNDSEAYKRLVSIQKEVLAHLTSLYEHKFGKDIIKQELEKYKVYSI